MLLRKKNERLRSKNEGLKADKAALRKELEEARSTAHKTGKGTNPTARAKRSTAATPTETPAMPASVSASSNPVLIETVSLESGARITVRGYESPVLPPSWFQQLSPGHELLAIDVEAYAGSNPEDYLTQVQQSDFKLQMSDSTRLRPALAAKEPALLNNPLAPTTALAAGLPSRCPRAKNQSSWSTQECGSA